jgi:C4-dicarboxylate-specific signal transduction histidine kinase
VSFYILSEQPIYRYLIELSVSDEPELSGPKTITTKLKSSNGNKIPVEVTLRTVNFNDAKYIVVVARDISVRLKIQQSYQQEQEKAARYEAQALRMTTLSAMSAGVVHEISQPLNAIKVLADGILFWQEIGRFADMPKVYTALKNISAQADRINDIIRHMRNLTSATEDRDLVACDLNIALNGAMQILGRQLAAHGIKVELDQYDKLPLVMGQEERLEEIIINLVVNAMYALDDHHQRNKEILCCTRQEDTQVILEIADNGPGISRELAAHIWEPFFTTRMEGEGMGLGLAIVQSIVSRIKGSINYYRN